MNEKAPLRPTFTGVHFWVSEMAASLAFYRAIGFYIPDGAEASEFVDLEVAEGVVFAFGTHTLTTGYHAGFVPSAGRGANYLQFVLDSREAVDALYGKLTGAGYLSHLAPIDAFWGARYAEVLDPDGNAVGFQSPRVPPPIV
ncbi:MAG: VOC family protein [Anaerolineaceae bacterium]